MIVTCPECLTKFRLEEERIPETGAKARCSKCGHVFQIQKPAPPDESFFSHGEDAEMGQVGDMGESSGRSFFRRKWVIPGVLVLLLAAGAIWYFGMGPGKGARSLFAPGEFLSDTAAALKKAALSLPFLNKYAGLGDQAQGIISLEKVKGYYVESGSLSRTFVIQGEAANHWKESRSFIKVKGTLLDSRGNKVREQEAYCGNILSEKDIREMSPAAVEKSLGSQFGVSFSNVNILPGNSVPFMIIFLDLPPEGGGSASSRGPAAKPGDVPPPLSDFTVEVVSSQKGSK
jgi:predicted Zn finger-like uncharacterized protein